MSALQLGAARTAPHKTPTSDWSTSMPPKVSHQDMRELKRLRDDQDREGYYKKLADLGYRYGELALGVVTGETFSGRAANAFLADVGHHNGQRITRKVAEAVSMGLMDADFDARRTAFSESSGDISLNQRTIGDYHANVFLAHRIPTKAWTAFLPLSIAAKRHKFFEKLGADGDWSSPEAAERTMWDHLQNRPSAYVHRLIAHAASHERDTEAIWWVNKINHVGFHTPLYMFTGDGSPYPAHEAPRSTKRRRRPGSSLMQERQASGGMRE